MKMSTGSTGVAKGWLPPATAGAAAQEEPAAAAAEPVDAQATAEREAQAALDALQGRAAWLAALVYRDLAALKVLLERLGAEEVAILANGRSTTVGVGFVMDGRAWLVFRGSDDDDDWVRNLFCLPAFHVGFHICHWEIGGKLRQWLNRVAPRKLPFCIVGHSLGGALATLATRRIARQGLPVEMLCTFGAPRVFWPGSAWRFNGRSANLPDPQPRKLGQVTYRFVDRYELVCYTPPFLALFRHVGRRIDCADLSEFLKEARAPAPAQSNSPWAGLRYAISQAPIVGPWSDAIAATGRALFRVVRAGSKAGKAHEMERYARRVDHWARHMLARDQKERVGPCAGGRVRFSSKLIMSALTLMLLLALYIAVPAVLIWGLWLLAVNVPWAAVGTAVLVSAGGILHHYWQWRDEHPHTPYVPKDTVFGSPPGKPTGSPFRQE